jgi:hypothetical protein
MYGQTMQFSMTDIDAARRGMASMEEAPDVQVEEPQASAPADAGETFVFAPTQMEPAAPAAPVAPPPPPQRQQQPQFFAPVQPQQMQMASGQNISPITAAQQQPMAAPPPKPASNKQQGDASMITGNDLMDQMDAFFNMK